jgi:hypothetical protein
LCILVQRRRYPAIITGEAKFSNRQKAGRVSIKVRECSVTVES